MKSYIAVVSWDGSTLTKFQDFDDRTDAESHALEYGGFVDDNPGGSDTQFWIVDSDANTLTNDRESADSNTRQRKWASLRSERDNLLKDSDWVLVSDSPLSDDQKQVWIKYRSELRDLPQNYDDPVDIIWPVKPV